MSGAAETLWFFGGVVYIGGAALAMMALRNGAQFLPVGGQSLGYGPLEVLIGYIAPIIAVDAGGPILPDVRLAGPRSRRKSVRPRPGRGWAAVRWRLDWSRSAMNWPISVPASGSPGYDFASIALALAAGGLIAGAGADRRFLSKAG